MITKDTSRETHIAKMSKGATIISAAQVAPSQDLHPAPPPTYVKINYKPFVQSLYAERAPPVHVSDPTYLWRVVREATSSHNPELRLVFNEIVRQPIVSSMKPVGTGGTVRVYIEQYYHRLVSWGVELELDALTAILTPYEFAGPGTGFDFATFSDVVREFGVEEARVRYAARQAELEASARRRPAHPTNALQSTTISVPHGHYGGEPQCRTLPGSCCGLNLNDDGTNNGFYFDAEK
eukprot:PhM_4_TR5868/c0_g1_i1/m.19481